MTRTVAVEWVKAWSPIIVALLGMMAAGAAKLESNNARIDADAAYTEVVAVSEASGQKSDSLYLAYLRIDALREEVAALKKSTRPTVVTGARSRAGRPSDRRPAGVTGLVTGAAAGLWSGVRSLFGG